MLGDTVDDWSLDAAGNLVLRRKGGGGPRYLLAAHLDQVVLWVKEILPGGFVRFSAPGQDPRHLPGQRVRVGALSGVVGMLPPHLQRPGDQAKTVPVEDLTVDLGTADSRLLDAIRVGDPIRYLAGGSPLGTRRFTAPGLDNRASVAACLRALEHVRGRSIWPDLYVVLTVQEEVGRWGAQAAAESVRPDMAVAVDVTFGREAGIPVDGSFPLDGGPAIGRGPNCHPGVDRHLHWAARRSAVPHQTEVLPGDSGTDAWVMQTAGGGTRTGTVSIPLLHMHTPVEVVSLDDVRWTARCLAESVTALDAARWEEVTSWC